MLKIAVIIVLFAIFHSRIVKCHSYYRFEQKDKYGYRTVFHYTGHKPTENSKTDENEEMPESEKEEMPESEKEEKTDESEKPEEEEEGMDLYPLEDRQSVYTDPTTWPCLNKFCMGKNQSPINLDTGIITHKPELESLTFENYDMELENLTITNHGYTVAINIPKSFNVTTSGDGFNGTYYLVKILFLYGNDVKKGSAHTVNSKYFNMEIVLIHLNEKYEKFTNEPDAIVALSVLVKLKKSDNSNLEPIISSLENITNPDESTNLTSTLKIMDLLPADTEHYVKYKGSALTPPCYDGSHTWIIPHHAIYISKNQLEKFVTLERFLEGEKQPKTGRKFLRPIQPLYDREIESTPFFNYKSHKSYFSQYYHTYHRS